MIFDNINRLRIFSEIEIYARPKAAEKQINPLIFP